MDSFRMYAKEIGILPTTAQYYLLDTLHTKPWKTALFIGTSILAITAFLSRTQIFKYILSSTPLSLVLKYTPLVIKIGIASYLLIKVAIVCALALHNFVRSSSYLGNKRKELAGKMIESARQKLDLIYKSGSFSESEKTQYSQEAYKNLLFLLFKNVSLDQESPLINILWIIILQTGNKDLEKATKELNFFPQIGLNYQQELENQDQILEIFMLLENLLKDKPLLIEDTKALIKKFQRHYQEGLLDALNYLEQNNSLNADTNCSHLKSVLEDMSLSDKILVKQLGQALRKNSKTSKAISDLLVEMEEKRRKRPSFYSTDPKSATLMLCSVTEFNKEEYIFLLDTDVIQKEMQDPYIMCNLWAKTSLLTNKALTEALVEKKLFPNFKINTTALSKEAKLSSIEHVKLIFDQFEWFIGKENHKQTIISLINQFGREDFFVALELFKLEYNKEYSKLTQFNSTN